MRRDATLPPDDQARLLASLTNPAVYGGDVRRVGLLETHISYVLLTGRYAYKIKKAVNLGFLDFTTLASRKYYCEQELRLNRRLAPAIYLDVVAITGSVDAPAIGGPGPIIEYAVKMREFPQDALLSRVLARGALTAAQIDTLAADVASFHGGVAVAGADAPFGVPDDILRRALQNFDQLRPLVDGAAERATLDELSEWTRREFADRLTLFERRRSGGFIRECHGDLHLGNIALVDGELTIFDCIEFDEQLRWIDVMSEVAFTVMELQNRQRADLGYRFLNAYLEITGDYESVGVLRFYLAYRAMVRAKVRRMRAAQLPAGDDKSLPLAEYRGYERLARDYARPPRPAIVITHGLAGCGKTTLSQALLEQIGAVRIRTDVERKRIHGLTSQARSEYGIDADLYSADATQQTYRHACALARSVVSAGHVAIVDATFPKRWQRELFRTLAAELAVPFVIVSFAASETTLRARIARRARDGTDASDATVAVLEHQLRTQEALAADERHEIVDYDAEAPLERARSPESWRDVLERIGRVRGPG